MAGQNLFNSIKLSSPKKSHFDMSHDVKLTCNMGELIPTLIMECVPGDKFNIGCDSLTRFQPLLAPMMHRVDQSMHYFFVPNRLVWPGWEQFITNDTIPGPLPAFPTLTMGGSTPTTRLANYLGIPNIATPPTGETTDVSALAFAAYQMCVNEYYRDQNLMAPINFQLVNGSNNGNTDLQVLRRRCWEHDYFTGALPFAQKGDPVTLPIGIQQDVPVYINKSNIGDPGTTLDGTPSDLAVANFPTAATDVSADQLYADTSTLTAQAATINDLRRAFRLQEWLEKAARGGSRYVENILSFFGVKSPDSRLNRPEYITGTKSPVIISEVLQNSATNATGTDTPQGNMAGHGVSVTQGKYGGYFCQEHGYIIGIMSVMPKTAYQQGIPRHFAKVFDPLQYYWPQFDHIGEQEIFNQEIYAFTIDRLETFGYIPRYAEYKFMNNRTCGDMATNLDFWSMTRIFDGQPQLNEDFIQADPTTRVFAVTDPDVQHLICHVLHKISALRPMSKYGTPTF